jgi:methylthioribose-1-phosphate isomerase
MKEVRPLWMEGGKLWLLDQKALPWRRKVLACERPEQVAEAIKSMTIRGAPALGIAAAYGIVLSLKGFAGNKEEALKRAARAAELLINTRPTAHNIRWAVERILRRLQEDEQEPYSLALLEAQAIEREDYEACRRMGELGSRLLEDGDSVLTHCKRE